ncbi:hypothetical protein R3P38DRAFT_3094933 [Favolaschia claudopus]|uniref:Uncharacterized protein n=1 Tax=Favolaschia claudopus TaxID=2862362 RepID=A0AAV9ZQD2_9AGAR
MPPAPSSSSSLAALLGRLRGGRTSSTASSVPALESTTPLAPAPGTPLSSGMPATPPAAYLPRTSLGDRPPGAAPPALLTGASPSLSGSPRPSSLLNPPVGTTNSMSMSSLTGPPSSPPSPPPPSIAPSLAASMSLAMPPGLSSLASATGRSSPLSPAPGMSSSPMSAAVAPMTAPTATSPSTTPTTPTPHSPPPGLLRPSLSVFQYESSRTLDDHEDYSRPIGGRINVRMASDVTATSQASTAGENDTDETAVTAREAPSPTVAGQSPSGWREV